MRVTGITKYLGSIITKVEDFYWDRMFEHNRKLMHQLDDLKSQVSYLKHEVQQNEYLKAELAMCKISNSRKDKIIRVLTAQKPTPTSVVPLDEMG